MVVVTRRISKAVVRIQRCARRYMAKHLMCSLSNRDDNDPITLEPVCSIPRDQLFVFRMPNGKKYGYDAYAWVQYMVRDSRHPSTRERLPSTAAHSCYTSAMRAFKARGAEDAAVVDALHKMRMPASLVHIEQRPAPERKFSGAARRRQWRWILLLRVSPLYTLKSVKVSGHMSTPIIEYEIEDSRLNQKFLNSASSILARSNQDTGMVALASDRVMAREASKLLADFEAGYISASDLNGFETEEEEEEEEEEEDTDGSWETTDEDSDFEP